MTTRQGSWTGGTLAPRDWLRPKQAARAVFHPAWIPDSLDPAVDTLKKVRLIAGTIAAVGVYTFVEGGFAFDEVLENMLTASAVLLFITPLTVGVMLYVWRRGGTVRALKVPLLNSLKLLLAFVGTIVVTVFVWRLAGGAGFLVLLLAPLAFWLTALVIRGAVHVSGNFFGTAGVHRCLPPLLATVTTWLMAIPDLVTGDLHGLSLTMGVVFILGAPLTVTGIALLEMGRLKQRYGIRLAAHPATLPQVPGPPPPMPPTAPPYMPQQRNPYGTTVYPPQGNPYGTTAYPPQGNPYGPTAYPPQGNPNGNAPYPPQGNPYANGNPYAPPHTQHHGNPYGPA
ncbi:proline-rich domain-containing protein [Streptomyces sp.]|uniref:proline-rich domain-containing protein n=1 Tax=Streptomyces sp. TaxID=1931 RepID=UPI002D74417B|nr:proline-rich domain-containing protein [Streptomyces sp.]HZF92214.1 proline-rich domain-containing protein [Streptomyces sp.]